MDDLFVKEVPVPKMRVINGRWTYGFSSYQEMTPHEKLAFEAMLNEAKNNQFH